MGSFNIYPATVFNEKNILAVAEVPTSLEVLSKKEIQDAFTLKDVIGNGKIEDIIAFVEGKNLLNKKAVDLYNLYWLLKNKKFY